MLFEHLRVRAFFFLPLKVTEHELYGRDMFCNGFWVLPHIQHKVNDILYLL